MLAIQQRDAFLLVDKDLVTQLFKETEKQLCPIESIVSNLSGRAFQRSPLSCTCFLLHVQLVAGNPAKLLSPLFQERHRYFKALFGCATTCKDCCVINIHISNTSYTGIPHCRILSSGNQKCSW